MLTYQLTEMLTYQLTEMLTYQLTEMLSYQLTEMLTLRTPDVADRGTLLTRNCFLLASYRALGTGLFVQ